VTHNPTDELKDTLYTLQRRRGALQTLEKQLQTARQNLTQQEAHTEHLSKAHAILQQVALQTQGELQFRITELVNLALAGVFDDPYTLTVSFVVRRDRTEVDLAFSRGDTHIDPMTASGGGPVDVAAFALRLCLWSMERPRTRPLLVLDEPFRFVSDNYLPRVGQLLEELCKRMGLQIIMVTHKEALMGTGKVFRVSMSNGMSCTVPVSD
jgi:DNA repair exonuclease SbcCD ATPase subunit